MSRFLLGAAIAMELAFGGVGTVSDTKPQPQPLLYIVVWMHRDSSFCMVDNRFFFSRPARQSVRSASPSPQPKSF